MKRIRGAACVALALSLSGIAAAQTLYRWTDAQGRTYYGDRPPKDGIGVTRVDTGGEGTSAYVPPAPAPTPVPAAAPKAVAPVAEADGKPAPDRATQRRETRERLRAGLERAIENLEAARKKLAEGNDMLEDERQTVQQRSGSAPVTATARQNCRPITGKDGKPALMCPVTVPNDQYYDRINKLEEAVRKAEEEVAEAESAYRRGVD